MTTPLDPVAAARDSLRNYNVKRYDSVQRDLFWNAEDWEALLQALIAAEASRDEELQRQIDDRSLTSAYLRLYEEQLFTRLQQEEDWYASEAAAMAQYATPALPNTPVPPYAYELAWHTLLLERRRLDRQVRQAEVALEIIERRRRAQGLLRGVWTGGWQRLTAAWANQDAWYQQLRDGEERPDLGVLHIPRTWRDEVTSAWGERFDRRLAWLYTLQSYQEASRHTLELAGLDSGDLEADSGIVAREISRLAPPTSIPVVSGGGAAGVLLVVAVVVVLAIGGLFSGFSGGSSTASIATPTSLSGDTVMVAMASGDPGAPTNIGLKATARALLRAGQCNEAVAAYEIAMQKTPDDYELYNDVAFCLYDLGRIDEAVMRWNEALTRNQNSADARAGLSMGLYTQGWTQPALENYARALELEPQYADPAFLRDQRSWSERALSASQPLRDTLRAP